MYSIMCKFKIIIRSCICNVLFFCTLGVMVVFSMLLMPFPQSIMSKYWYYLASVLNFVAKYTAGINANVLGMDKAPKPCIFACRHESLWETMFLVTILKNSVFVLKKELVDIPVFGAFLNKLGSISVDRSHGASALLKMAKQVNKTIKSGRSVIIFPEGTRRSPNDDVRIKKGVLMLYKTAKCPVVPIALNSGHFWPKRGFIKYPGTITVKFLKPIEPGLDTDCFLDTLQNQLDATVKELHALTQH